MCWCSMATRKRGRSRRAALVHAGLAKKVLLTHQQLALESNNVQSGGTLSEFELTRQVLLARGVPKAPLT